MEDGLGIDPAPVLATAGRRYAELGCAQELSVQVRTYLVALREALLDQGCTADQASALVAESLARAAERMRVPLELAAWSHHPRNRLARARWRQQEELRLFFSGPGHAA